MRVYARVGIAILLLLVAWQLTVTFLGVPSFLLPAPIQVAKTLIGEGHALAAAAVYTTGNMAVGAILAISLGVATGVLAGQSRRFSAYIEPYLAMFQSFPREALLPLLVVWLGFGRSSKIVSSVLLGYFPVAVMTLNGLRNVRHDYVELVRSWGGTRWDELVHCRLPAAVPEIAGAVRVAVPLCLIGAVLGEFMGGSLGLGHIIITSGATFRVDRNFASVIILATIGASLVSLVRLVERTLLKRYFFHTDTEGTSLP